MSLYTWEEWHSVHISAKGILDKNMLPLVSELTQKITKVVMSLNYLVFSYTFQALVAVTA